jgi:hypothetical protein
MREQAEEVARIVKAEADFQERMRAETSKMATALIQGYLGPDHKILDMPTFHSALSQALRQAREQGQVDRSGDLLGL